VRLSQAQRYRSAANAEAQTSAPRTFTTEY
jgi:hypothetical protein